MDKVLREVLEFATTVFLCRGWEGSRGHGADGACDSVSLEHAPQGACLLSEVNVASVFSVFI